MRKKTKKAASGASAAANFLEKVLTMAEELAVVRKELSAREQKFREETEWLLKRRSELQAKVVRAFKTLGVNSIKNKKGETIYITTHPAFAIADLKERERWAVSKGLYRLDENRIHTELLRARALKKLPLFVKGTMDTPTVAITKKRSKISTIL